MKKQKTVSLVLGSGGARGLAHAGIIRCLEDHDYKIVSISGSSIGALIGGFYAAGKLDIYVDWLKGISTFEMLKLLDFKGSGGLISGKKLMTKLEELVGDINIEDLDIKFTAIASDINVEKEIWINQGSLLKAIRASISLPLFFTPYEYKGKLLVDGGVLNPVPIAPSFHDDADITIAVNLSGESTQETLDVDEEDESSWMRSVTEYFKKLSLPEPLVSQNSMSLVANKSFETMQGSLARMKLAAYPPDVLLEVPRNLCKMFDFQKSQELVEYGYKLCERNEFLK
ncbi:MAG: patatin-like phospholipase family protein [Helicobacteraceae bacterium]|nr:patatin-like phospholipase family protein [Helicobacteraceae bacterium]